jgi:hypothetical protein
MIVGDTVKYPTPLDVTLVGFPPTIYILNFTNSNGKVFKETIILNELPTTEAIEKAIAMIIQKLNWTIDREENNWNVTQLDSDFGK